MLHSEFDKFQEQLFEKIKGIRDKKGKEYANSNDRFANFIRLESKLGITRLQVVNVFLTKHLDAIDNYCKVGHSHSEEHIIGRIEDAICYLSLMAGMIMETPDGAKSEYAMVVK